MRLEHADTRAECVVETVSTGLNPEQHPDDGEIEKENYVWHFPRGKRDCDNGGAAGDRPVRGHVQPLPPHHDPTHFAPIEMRHRIDITWIVNAPLNGNRPFLFWGYSCILSCHDFDVRQAGRLPYNYWITGFAA